MKKTEKIKWFSLGIAVCIMLTVAAPQALAARVERQATLLFNNIRISLNGNLITPRDAQGNAVEPFIIDGTTYLPVRAIGDALGLSVDWDGATNTVLLRGRNYHINMDDPLIRRNQVRFDPSFVRYTDDGWLRTTIFVSNGYLDRRVTVVDVDLRIYDHNDILIAQGNFRPIDLSIRADSFVIHTFNFAPNFVLNQNADFRSLRVTASTNYRWQLT